MAPIKPIFHDDVTNPLELQSVVAIAGEKAATRKQFSINKTSDK